MSDQSKPNVLLISTDHWPANLLGCADHPAVQTPTLDALAASGVRFPNAYASCPVCIPARRTLWTGLSPHSHGMFQNEARRLPEGIPTLAQTFRDNGYHAVGVGKIEVFPTRARVGFDETILDFEGRGFARGDIDDYEIFLADNGHPGERFAGGMCTNDYVARPWHLDEQLHVTNWTTQQMCRSIIRRDPDKPGFWFLSYSKPHPPLDPLRDYLNMYRDIDIPMPVYGDWAENDPPARVQTNQLSFPHRNMDFIREARRAFYALCTHIDHQLRVVIGTLSQHGLLNNTIICFTADHGDMLGDHGMWGKQVGYEPSANIPMIVSGTSVQADNGVVGHHRVDDRLVSFEDVYVTLLELAGIDVPKHAEGLSMVGDKKREIVLSVNGLAANATRTVRDDRYKLVYYPAGNRRQLFDLQDDPNELHDLAGSKSHAGDLSRLTDALVARLTDEREAAWLKDGELVGLAEIPESDRGPFPNRSLHGQRGMHFPPPHAPWVDGST